jgi:outer membrane protein assembly factor BamB
VILAGKSRIVYLLNGAHLGGIGAGEATLGDACSNDIDGGAAFSGTVVYLPCLSGPVAIRVAASPPGLRELWHASVGGGPAIIAGGEVWTVAQSGVLYGLSPATGKVRQQAQIGALSNHFTTPSVGDGLLLVASSNRVVTFRAAT